MPRPFAHKTKNRRQPENAHRSTRAEKRANKRANRRQPETCQPDFEDGFTRPVKKPNLQPFVAMTHTQADYVDCIEGSRVTFGIGPAGTGKTWVAVRIAVGMLLDGEIEKIYLTRPAEEAGGEKLGFLPGTLDEKYEPYLRPFSDAFIEMLGASHFEYLLKEKIIEPVPLGFLRGATIKNAMLLADEMQNASKGQFKMLLTRIGEGTSFIINGDPAQVDIPRSQSGLMDAVNRLGHRDEFSCVRFTRDDIVRDGIVQVVIEAYNDDEDY